jgi:hypothetical protein
VSPYPCEPDRFLTDAHLKATRRRAADGWYEHALVGQSHKKDVVRSLAVRALPEGGSEARIEAGEAFAVEQFLRTAFALPSVEDWVRTRVRARLGDAGSQA